jgi:hypothetical protein
MSVSFNCGSPDSFLQRTMDCQERKKPVSERNWEILQYRCNHSAFNGYHYTPSDYSTVRCCSCGAVGRTKAKYVDSLREAP